jgi:hypothetical protein
VAVINQVDVAALEQAYLAVDIWNDGAPASYREPVANGAPGYAADVRNGPRPAGWQDAGTAIMAQDPPG